MTNKVKTFVDSLNEANYPSFQKGDKVRLKEKGQTRIATVYEPNDYPNWQVKVQYNDGTYDIWLAEYTELSVSTNPTGAKL